MWVGYKAGLFREILRFFVIFLTLFCTYVLSPVLGEVLGDKVSYLKGTPADIISVIGVTGLAYLIFALVALLVSRMVKESKGTMIKMLGIVAAVGRWAFILSVVFMLIGQFDFAGLHQDITERSILARPILPIASTAFEYLSGLLPEISIAP